MTFSFSFSSLFFFHHHLFLLNSTSTLTLQKRGWIFSHPPLCFSVKKGRSRYRERKKLACHWNYFSIHIHVNWIIIIIIIITHKNSNNNNNNNKKSWYCRIVVRSHKSQHRTDKQWASQASQWLLRKLRFWKEVRVFSRFLCMFFVLVLKHSFVFFISFIFIWCPFCCIHLEVREQTAFSPTPTCSWFVFALSCQIQHSFVHSFILLF